MAEDPWAEFRTPSPASGGDDPWAAFREQPAAAPGGGPSLRATERPQNALSPITNYPEHYGEIRRGAQELMGSGLEQVGTGYAGLTDPNIRRPALGPFPVTPLDRAAGNVAAGLGRAGLGAVEYAASPISAGIRSVVGEPIQNVTGIPKEYTEFATGLALPIPKRIPLPAMDAERLVFGRPQPPSTTPTGPQLRAAAAADYQAPEVVGTVLAPRAVPRLQEEIRADLKAANANDVSAPTVFAHLDRFAPEGALTVRDLEGLRQRMGEISPTRDVSGAVTNKPELRAAGIARERIDTFLREAPQSETLFGNPQAASATLERARANTSAAESAETINRKQFTAELRAAVANSGRNVSNTMRARIADILDNPSLRRGYSADELAMMDRIVRGTRPENALRTAGNVLGGGGGAHAFYSGLLTAGVAPTAGYGLKSLSNAITARNIDRLNAMVRSDSPLGREMAAAKLGEYTAAQQAFEASPTARNLGRLMIATQGLESRPRTLADLGE